MPDIVLGTEDLVGDKGSPSVPLFLGGRHTVHKHTQINRIILDSDKCYEGKNLKRWSISEWRKKEL